jgi:predicted house-cleaning noncanonical NTP pyrophosphatase (MazG superfamily)
VTAGLAGAGKLIRDRVPEGYGWAGVRVLDEAGYRAALRAKLQEESLEYLAADTPAQRRAELADVLEVLLALAAHDGCSPDELEAARLDERTRRGDFSARLWWQP